MLKRFLFPTAIIATGFAMSLLPQEAAAQVVVRSVRPGFNRGGVVVYSPNWNNGWNNPGWNNPGWNNPGWNNPQWNNPQWNNPGWNNRRYSYRVNRGVGFYRSGFNGNRVIVGARF